MAKKHPCPLCGRETEGSYSEGGILWAICDDCMNENFDEATAHAREFEHLRRHNEGTLDNFV